jgi:hypothetical protein
MASGARASAGSNAMRRGGASRTTEILADVAGPQIAGGYCCRIRPTAKPLTNAALRFFTDGRQSNRRAVHENTGRRFRECDISANVGAKLHAQVKDKMTRFMAEATPHFPE